MAGVRCNGNPQCGYIGHVSILGGLRLSTTIFFFLASPRKGGTWNSRWTSAIHFYVIKYRAPILVHGHSPTYWSLILLTWACRCGVCCMPQRTRSDTSDDERPKKMNEIQNCALRQGCGTGAETGGCLRTGFATGVKKRGCRKTAEPRQGGCREDKGCLGAVVEFYERCTARAQMAAPLSTGSPWHREHVLVPKSHRM